MVLGQFRKEAAGTSADATQLVGEPGRGFGGVTRRSPGRRKLAGETLGELEKPPQPTRAVVASSRPATLALFSLFIGAG